MAEPQRRLAAVMFTDIVGFTALGQRDEALALRLVEEHRRIVRPLFVQYNGREIKTIGDAFLVEFDSALDAARCAVDAQRLLHERNLHVPGEPIELRIGIHVGDVIHQENDAYGDAVNVASRIHAMAEPGGICLSEQVASHLRGKIGLALERLPPAQLKGVSQPIELYRLGLPWTVGGASLTTPWVDREAELARADRLLTRALRGEGSVLLFSGEAGIGKSRLAEEIAGVAQRGGGLVLRGRCTQGDLAAPYAPWAEAIRQFVREVPRQLLYKVVGTHGSAVARLVPEVLEKIGPVPESPPSDPLNALTQFLEGLWGFFSNLATESPLVFLLDDLQWADSASLTVLLFLARRVRSHPILVVGAYREEEAEQNPSLHDALSQLNRERLSTVVSLGRFDLARTSEMISRTFHTAETSVDFAQLIQERTGGNPFFVEEVLRALVRDGTIFWSPSGWDRKPVREIELPRALREAIAGRLRPLDETTVDTLRLASVIGYEFDFDLLRSVSGLDDTQLLDRLEQALKAGLVGEEERPGRRLIYRFADHQIRDAVYAEISLVRRRRLHLKVAEAMEGATSSSKVSLSDALAYHFLLGNAPAKALPYSVRAGENATRLYAHTEAVRHFQNAAELCEETDDRELLAKVSLSLGHEFEASGKGRESVDAFGRAAELFGELGRQRARGEALACQGAVTLDLLGEMPPARQLLQEAVRILEPEGESRELALAYVYLGYLLTEAGEYASARPYLEKGTPLAAGFGLADVQTIGLQFLAITSPVEGIERGMAQLREAAELAERGNAARTSTKWANLAVNSCYHLADLAAASAACDRADLAAARRAAPEHMRYAKAVRCILAELQGDWRRARELAQGLVDWVPGSGSALPSMYAARILARLDLHQGHAKDAARWLERASAIALQARERDELGFLAVVQAELDANAGMLGAAVETLEHARTQLIEGGVTFANAHQYVDVLVELARYHLASGHRASAEAIERELHGIAERARLPWFTAGQLTVRGSLARDRGDHREAAEMFSRVADVWAERGLRYHHALALGRLATELESLGERERAREARSLSEATLRELGAVVAARQLETTGPPSALARKNGAPSAADRP